MGENYYAAYGLRIRSELALPHFGPAAPGEADVVVRLGEVPRSLPAPRRTGRRWQAASGDFLLCVDDKLRYRVTGGREVTVERPGGADDVAAVYLMGSVCTALLQQRGFLTLHASAVGAGGNAVLFLGKSGAGKSTLAAALGRRGFEVFADDVSAVRIDPRGTPRAMPGYPNLRLWGDALGMLGLQARNRRRARDGIDKYLLPAEKFVPEPRTVAAAYELGNWNAETFELGCETTAGAFRILRRHTHRRRYAEGFGSEAEQFDALAGIARNVPVRRVTRTTKEIAPDALCESIERDLAGD